jgi:3-demethoxyubiquinol 3-hydroxylase
MIDTLIIEFDRALRTVFGPARSERQTPGADQEEAVLSDAERSHIAGLMRVNHVGEICAQALYQGQALTSSEQSVTDALRQAGHEETEHLAWTEQRLGELGGRKSLLNPLWYSGALSIGILAGKFGDRWSLGFLAETERQVEAHLAGHIERVPSSDGRSQAILEQMRSDEASHAETALALGAAELPAPVRLAMKLASGVMTRVAYRI